MHKTNSHKNEPLVISENPALDARAKEIASQYRILIDGPSSDGWYTGTAVEMLMVSGLGQTIQACYDRTLRNLTLGVRLMLEEGQKPPRPSQPTQRTEQLNLRVSGEEKLLITEAAREGGFAGASDFIRTTVMSALRRGQAPAG